MNQDTAPTSSAPSSAHSNDRTVKLSTSQAAGGIVCTRCDGIKRAIIVRDANTPIEVTTVLERRVWLNSPTLGKVARMMLAIRLVCFAVVMAASVVGCVPDAGAQDEVVARVGDTEVTFAEVEESWNQTDASSRLRMLQQLYEARRRALDLVIGEHLVARDARTRGITRAELLAAELPSRTNPVTDEEVALVYERNRNSFDGRTLEKMQPEIRMVLEQQRPTQTLHQFMAELRMAADDVVILLDPPRQAVDVLADDPSRGPDDAPVVIVEFSDFECPFCKRATATLDVLLERYGDQLRFVFKDFPLPSHPHAFKAAEAGNCAHEQGKFWEFHDKLFASQDALDVPSLKTYAGELGLDTEVFVSCLDEGRYAAAVNRDLSIGRSSGVSSTPTLFINGRPLFGAFPLETFDQILREELDAAGR